MFNKYLNFIRGISVNWYGKAGVILTTSSFITFIIFQLALIAGLLTNAYVGLIIYLLFPALFVLGLLLIPISWYKYRKDRNKPTLELLNERFPENDRQPRLWGSNIFKLIIGLTLLNILILGGASSRMLHFMDEPVFCGTACHSVMNPEWTTYQASPHARVKCVECHVGEGVGALVDSKLNGLWQMISLTFSLYEKPIPAPVHQLRPARETCEKCHWPEKFYGARLKTIIHYGHDSLSTPAYTTLALKIDAGTESRRRGIHWHIEEHNEIRYSSADDKREKMIWVEVKQADGTYKRYTNKEIASFAADTIESRILDCMDCHNRATHIYEYPDDAIDSRITEGKLDRSAPFLAGEAAKAILASYRNQDEASIGIEKMFYSYYEKNFPDWTASNKTAIDSVITSLKEIYTRNIHPQMNITWGSYPNHIGHKNSSGCFRCHNENMLDSDSKNIRYDCSLCHSLAAYDSPTPFAYLGQPDLSSRDYNMHRYLRDEFFQFYR